MHVELIEVPYDSGHWGTRMGRGPAALRAAGAAATLRAAGHLVAEERVQPATPLPTEVATGFRVVAAVSARVRAAVWQGRFPIVLAGNCLTSVGVLAGLAPASLGIVWLDAHGDFHTPESTTSGFLDGMALAVATGRCWRAMAAGVPGFRPVDPERVVLAGARDLDPAERVLLDESAVARVAPDTWEAALPTALDRLRERVADVHLHLDLDVLDPAEGAANGYAAPGGPTLEGVVEAVRSVHARFRVRAATLSAFDPAADGEGRALRAALRIVGALPPPGTPLP